MQMVPLKGTMFDPSERLHPKRGFWIWETFWPVVRFFPIRLILAIIAHLDLDLYQMDVKTALLNRELDGEIYMDQSIGFTVNEEEHKVCKL